MTEQEKVHESDLLTLLWEIRSCFAKISVKPYDKELVEEQSDVGMRMCHDLEDMLCRIAQEAVGIELIPENVFMDANDWHFTKDDDLPYANETVLFSTISGQTFEGFLERRDVFNPRIVDGRIAFDKHKNGWGWYRYRFRDYLEPHLVTAWKYKPVLEVEDDD